MNTLHSLLLFMLARLAEIGGGWVVWRWLRTGWSLRWGLLDGGVPFLYGILPTLQTEPAFGQVYAAYGGIFIVQEKITYW